MFAIYDKLFFSTIKFTFCDYFIKVFTNPFLSIGSKRRDILMWAIQFNLFCQTMLNIGIIVPEILSLNFVESFLFS